MGDSLHRSGQRPDDVDARHRLELAKLLHAELRIAGGDDRPDWAFLHHHALHLARDTEVLQQLHEIYAACADLRMRDRARRDERALQSLDRADVRFARAGAHRNADARASKRANVRDVPGFGELFHCLRGEDHEVGAEPGGEPRHDRLGGVEVKLEPRPERSLELPPRLLQHAFQRKGAKDDEAQASPSKSCTLTGSPAFTAPRSCSSTMKQFASDIERSTPEPCWPVVRTFHPPCSWNRIPR